jgi:hypothetical protein
LRVATLARFGDEVGEGFGKTAVCVGRKRQETLADGLEVVGLEAELGAVVFEASPGEAGVFRVLAVL